MKAQTQDVDPKYGLILDLKLRIITRTFVTDFE